MTRRRADGRALFTELGVHLIVLLAVVFALYPVLWVVALALSPGDAPEPRVLPFPDSPSLEHFAAVLGVGRLLFDRCHAHGRFHQRRGSCRDAGRGGGQ